MTKKKRAALSGKKSPAEQAKVKATRKRVVKKVLATFVKLAQGLVKVWHKNHAFIISKEDAIDLTLEQLEALVGEREKATVTPE